MRSCKCFWHGGRVCHLYKSCLEPELVQTREWLPTTYEEIEFACETFPADTSTMDVRGSIDLQVKVQPRPAQRASGRRTPNGIR